MIHLLPFLQKPPTDFVLASTKIEERDTLEKYTHRHRDIQINWMCQRTMCFVIQMNWFLVCMVICLKLITIFALAVHNQAGTLVVCMSLHNCRVYNPLLHKQSNISQCFGHWSRFDLSPYLSDPMPMDHFLRGHWNMPADVLNWNS